ncbi:MAG: hypothetical protein U0263_03620 [Polyangiaceae bacterium]
MAGSSTASPRRCSCSRQTARWCTTPETTRLCGACGPPPPRSQKPPRRAAPKGERPATSERAKPKSLTYAERLELEKLPERIEASEARVRELEARISEPSFFRGAPAEVKETLAELDAAREEALGLLARWEELETRAG